MRNRLLTKRNINHKKNNVILKKHRTFALELKSIGI